MHDLAAAEEKMRADGADPTAVDAFRRAYAIVASEESPFIPDAELDPVTELPQLDDLPPGGSLDDTVVVKLNGGLGTSMGLHGPKSLLPALKGRTFLDLIDGQAAALGTPLLLMNSFATNADTLAALAEPFPEGDARPGGSPPEGGARPGGVPPDGDARAGGARPEGAAAVRTFLQAREPKLLATTLEPATWPPQPDLEWCPPGHGDVYRALAASGILDELIEQGYARAFLSNADNLAAVPNPRIARWMKENGAPFVSEQVRRTPADRKGGHIARRRADGRLILRETAQTPPDERDDLSRHPFAHPNNLWVDLRALRELLDTSAGVLDLPVIANPKTLDPSDPATPHVLQLETAMGAAIGLFEKARALLVPRERFAPVKTTDDLLVLRSDVYELNDDRVPRPVAEPPVVTLDPRYYAHLDDFEARFPHGPPSLREATSFTVRGDVTFDDPDLVIRGDVVVEA